MNRFKPFILLRDEFFISKPLNFSGKKLGKHLFP